MAYKIESYIEELHRKYRKFSESDSIDKANEIILEAIDKLDKIQND